MPPPIEIVGTLRAGTVAVLLEVLALAMGLVIAANLQAIVSLSARRRLYVRGRATLSDTTWGVGIIEGFTNPRLLLRDYRTLCAFLLAVLVAFLEALTVLQTQPGESCDFYKPSSWTIQQKDLGCVNLQGSIFKSYQYVSKAVEVLRDANVDVGIPINTDVFEESVLTGPAVNALKTKEKRFLAPLMNVSTATAVVKTNGLSLRAYKSGDITDGRACLEEEEDPGYFPLDLEFLGSRLNENYSAVITTGFVDVEGCQNVLTIRVCSHGRKKLTGRKVEDVTVQCDIFDVDREGRRTQTLPIASVVADGAANGTTVESVRRAVLVGVVAENSAAQVPCKRFVAVPKRCTQIGWVSLMAVVVLGILFLGSLAMRMVLRRLTKPALNWNSDQTRLVQSILEHFDADSWAQNRRSKAFNTKEEDIHISVLPNNCEDERYHVAWTREPVAVAPALRVRSDEIVPAIDTGEEVEVSLV